MKHIKTLPKHLVNQAWVYLSGIALVFTMTAVPYGQAQENIEDAIDSEELTKEDENENLVSFSHQSQVQKNTAALWSNPRTGVVYGNSNIKLILESEDDLSQVSHIEYRINNKLFARYTTPISILEEGAHNIVYRAIDLAGNKEALKSYSITIDNTPPQVSIHPAQIFISVNERLYTSSQNSFSIKALDELSGVARISYGINAAPTIEYNKNTNIILSGEGVKLITCKASDNLGHTTIINVLAEIDDLAPSVAIHPSTSLINANNKDYAQKSTSFSVKAIDTDSGLANILIRVDGSPNWEEYTSPIFFEEETEHTIEAKAIDLVGNESEIVVMRITVDELPPTSKLRLQGLRISPSNEEGTEE